MITTLNSSEISEAMDYRESNLSTVENLANSAEYALEPVDPSPKQWSANNWLWFYNNCI